MADSHWRTVTEAAVIGALEERSLLQDTVIVSDNAGQFDVFTHALCWAERHLRKLVCVSSAGWWRRSVVWCGGTMPT